MASCYICGKEHVTYRRTVSTGRSNRFSYSSRGRCYNSSTNYSGVRTVCAKCALQIDYNNKKQTSWATGVLIAWVAFGLFFWFLGMPFFVFLIGVGVCISLVVISQKITNENASIWYSQNYNKYIDEIDAQRQLQETLKKAKERAIQEKTNRICNQLTNSAKFFTDRMSQETELLKTRLELLNGNYTVNQIEDFDDLMKKLDEGIAIANETKKTLFSLCDDYIKQCKSLVPNKTILDDYLKQIEQTRAVQLNMVNDAITQLKQQQNIVLKEKIKKMKSPRYTN